MKPDIRMIPDIKWPDIRYCPILKFASTYNMFFLVGLDQWNFVMHPVDAAYTCDPKGMCVCLLPPRGHTSDHVGGHAISQ